MTAVDDSNPTIRIYDKTVVVTGHAVYHYRNNKTGEKSVAHTLYTEVFILKDGRWQCVSGHYTPLNVPEQ